MLPHFRQAIPADQQAIWEILLGAIARRKADGSEQWQDGYPNPSVVASDIERGIGFVLLEEEVIVGYAAILINDEPSYNNIIGQWLTNGDFVVVHRVAISDQHIGKGLAKKLMLAIEEYAKENNVYSIKADTNFDNAPMLALFEKLGYTYCGEVMFRGNPRKAYEKLLKETKEERTRDER